MLPSLNFVSAARMRMLACPGRDNGNGEESPKTACGLSGGCLSAGWRPARRQPVARARLPIGPGIA
jgi:hypothetical protein